MKSSLTKALVVSSLLATSGIAMAATQGTLGAESSGEVVISVTTVDQIKISGLTDIALAEAPSGEYMGTSGACVYRNASGSYTLRADGSGTNNAFVLSDGGTYAIPYTVNYDDGNGSVPVSAATTLLGRKNANTAAPDCGGSSNGVISVSVAQADIASVPAGTYSGTLTLTVAPE